MNTGMKVTAGVTATTHDIDIDLPEHDCIYETTNESGFIDVEPAYRKSTVLRLIEADRKRRGELAGWNPVDGNTHGYEGDIVLRHKNGEYRIGHSSWIGSNIVQPYPPTKPKEAAYMGTLRMGYTSWMALDLPTPQPLSDNDIFSNPVNHNLYKTGDKDAPEQIRDRNGEVVLDYCKRCGKFESQLSEPCVAEPVDKGPWRAGVNRNDKRTFIESDDFTHDVRLYVDGDFADQDEKLAYAKGIADQLNGTPQPTEHIKDEPVAWLVRDDMLGTWLFRPEKPEQGLWKYVKPLYTAPYPAESVKVDAIFETQDGEVIGTTDAKVKRVEWQDDGSLTVVIDYWPQSDEPMRCKGCGYLVTDMEHQICVKAAQLTEPESCFCDRMYPDSNPDASCGDCPIRDYGEKTAEPVLVGWAVSTTGGGLLHSSKYTEYEARRAGYSLPLYRLITPKLVETGNEVEK